MSHNFFQLMPGVKYVLNVIVEKENKVVENTVVNLDSTDGVTSNETKKPSPSGQILLYASNTSYVDIYYYVFAEIILCTPVEKYRVRQQM